MNRAGLQWLMVAVLCLPWSAVASCRVYASTWERQPSLVMENDLIRVTVLPDSNGSIAEYCLKQPGFNVITPIRNARFALTKDVAIVDSNYGGYKDWCLETGVLKAERAYVCRVVAESPEHVSIVASSISSVQLERSMTIHEGSTLVDIRVVVRNVSAEPMTYSYWAHTLIAPAGRIDNREVFCVPVGAHRVSTRNKANLDSLEDAVAAVTNTAAPSASVSFLPKQGWKAVVSTSAQAVYGELIPIAQIGDDGYFDFWKGQEHMELGNPTSLLTSESVYSARALAPDEAATFNLAMFQALGFSGISYASSNLCLHVRDKTIHVKTDTLVVEAGAPAIRSGLNLGFALTDDAGEVVAVWGAQRVDLGPMRTVTLTFRTDGLRAPPGTYGLRCILRDGAGNEIETASVLGVRVIID
ncbi:MAG: hypothetical protein PHR35_08865 [Kiritimatiellae bacterium]|nr:hypothetical protein [Kiritimatiellia bacterium]